MMNLIGNLAARLHIAALEINSICSQGEAPTDAQLFQYRDIMRDARNELNALTGIASSTPGSVKRLVEAVQWPQGTATPEFLQFIAHRLVNVYGESPNTDFVLSLHQRALEMRAALAEIKVEEA